MATQTAAIRSGPVLEPARQPQPRPGRERPAVLVSVQALRAVAATAVLLFHVHLVPLGFAGVDVFFVLSGLIMGMVGVKERPGVFMRRRVARIVPLYWAVTLAMCGLAGLGLLRNFRFDAESLVKSLLFVPFRNGDGELFPLVVPGWTLNFEMMFYAVFALLLPTGRVREWALVVLLALGAVGAMVAFRNPVLATYTSPLLFEFAGGLALSLGNPLDRLPGRLPQWGGMALLAYGVIGFVLFAWLGDLSVQGLPRVLLLGGPALALVAGALAIERAGAWPDIPGARLLGDASYSLYLTHGIVLAGVALVAHKLGGGQVLEVVVGIGAAVVVAIATYRWFERPVTRLLR